MPVEDSFCGKGSAVVRSLCPPLGDPMDFSTPGFPVLPPLPCAHTHIHWVGDVVHPSDVIHPLLPPFSSCLQYFLASGSLLMSWLFASMTKVLELRFSIGPSNEYTGLISFRIDCLISLQSKRLSRVFSSTTAGKHQFCAQPSLWSNTHICTWLLGKP